MRLRLLYSFSQHNVRIFIVYDAQENSQANRADKQLWHTMVVNRYITTVFKNENVYFIIIVWPARFQQKCSTHKLRNFTIFFSWLEKMIKEVYTCNIRST